MSLTQHLQNLLGLGLSEVLVLKVIDIPRECTKQDDCHVRVFNSHGMYERGNVSGLANETLVFPMSWRSELREAERLLRTNDLELP